MKNVYPVVLSGGVGSRLWPLSRKHYPKQFLKLMTEHTMFQDTITRLTDYNNPMVVCNDSHRFIVAEQMREVGITPRSIILEPLARNTAPAIALAALRAIQDDPDAVLVVLSADHHIVDVLGFQKAVDVAVSAAEKGSLVTFGIKPTKPETGYGYIKCEISDSAVLDIQQFVEKPDQATAELFYRDSMYFWNSGMFVFRAADYLDELGKHAPDIVEHAKASVDNAKDDLDFLRVDAEHFAKCPDISIDYAVMEHTVNAKVVPADIGWSDVGSFNSLWELGDKDEHGMVVKGDSLNMDSTNCLIQTEEQLVTTLGVEDLIIISTKDTLLVANMACSQSVKKLVEIIEDKNRTEHLTHREVHRPWGKYDSIDNGERYQVKRITVSPGKSLSKQMHYHRAEHWIVVSGSAIVEIEEKETLLTENESIYVPLGSVHRLTNPGKVDLELIEVQSGSYLGEDDIVRFEDNFGRV